ncbi:hypothetical protein L3X38_036668 [Prunus dulcis]|uniref:Uncharacterized protein n=1 Tax=Prunus dulcis TaxID=3755 RepID=A0AAD4V378_PRUDU|nr:hypothetical protein L3X38_036668 [Prunus dulcis]
MALGGRWGSLEDEEAKTEVANGNAAKPSGVSAGEALETQSSIFKHKIQLYIHPQVRNKSESSQMQKQRALQAQNVVIEIKIMFPPTLQNIRAFPFNASFRDDDHPTHGCLG